MNDRRQSSSGVVCVVRCSNDFPAPSRSTLITRSKSRKFWYHWWNSLFCPKNLWIRQDHGFPIEQWLLRLTRGSRWAKAKHPEREETRCLILDCILTFLLGTLVRRLRLLIVLSPKRSKERCALVLLIIVFIRIFFIELLQIGFGARFQRAQQVGWFGWFRLLLGLCVFRLGLVCQAWKIDAKHRVDGWWELAALRGGGRRLLRLCSFSKHRRWKDRVDWIAWVVSCGCWFWAWLANLGFNWLVRPGPNWLTNFGSQSSEPSQVSKHRLARDARSACCWILLLSNCFSWASSHRRCSACCARSHKLVMRIKIAEPGQWSTQNERVLSRDSVLCVVLWILHFSKHNFSGD